jgi:GTPase SAR1 family protein
MVENAKNAAPHTYQNLLVVGDTGAGKTAMMLSLPGKKFAYLFDPSALSTLSGFDIDYEEWLPDHTELDTTIKKFNRDGKPDDKPVSKREPKVYLDWCTDIAEKSEAGFFEPYDWVCFDSLTLLQKACFDRQTWINNRYGKPEEMADYRIVGSKMSDLIRSATSEKINCFFTGHIDVWQDELSKKITTQLALSGSAKRQIPLAMSNIWLAECKSTESTIKYTVQTRPADRGLQTIRSSIRGLEMFEEVTISDFNQPEQSGISKLLNGQ